MFYVERLKLCLLQLRWNWTNIWIHLICEGGFKKPPSLAISLSVVKTTDNEIGNRRGFYRIGKFCTRLCFNFYVVVILCRYRRKYLDPKRAGFITQSLGSSPAPIVPSRLLADPIELERRLAEAGHDGFGALCEETTPPSPPPTIIEQRMHHRVSLIVAGRRLKVAWWSLTWWHFVSGIRC